MNEQSRILLGFLILALFALSACDARRSNDKTSEKEAEAKNRKGKLLPIFQVYKFRNAPCIGGGSKNGTCYTAAECSAKGGTAEGGCMSNFGVCCTFTASCGATTSENCTYFESSGAQSGGCQLRVCKCSTDICQLRLDFNQFMITGPSTDTNSIGKATNGQVFTGGSKSVSSGTQCLTDTFVVTNPSGQTPPTICGINTGEHMYVDASDACNLLTFQLGNQGIGTGIQTRQWSIKVNQYSCNYNNLAPDGCTQYFFGPTTDTVQTYNFEGGQHLANQDQNICVRRERGNCRICWAQALDTDFQVSGNPTSKSGKVKGTTGCCGYGTAGTKTAGYDCVSIPGALKATSTQKLNSMGNFICGQNLVTATGTAPMTVCSDRTPFYLRFLSDQYEFIDSMEAAMPDKGFRLTYIQSSQGCSTNSG